MALDEYLTVAELAARLKLSAKTIRNKIASGVFQRGIHYFSPAGIAPRFKWSAVVAWLEESEDQNDNPSKASMSGQPVGLLKTRGLEIGDEFEIEGHNVR